VQGTRAANGLRASGIPVLHLADDLPPERAAEYARSVGAAWICYPAPEGLKLASAAPGDGFEPVTVEAVASKVLS
jgi:ATP phosphoribosyltransferase regulatory subunit